MIFQTENINIIRQACKSCDNTGKVTDDILNFIYENKLFKLVVPNQFGGKMFDLPEATKMFQQASYIDGNFGWLVTIGSGGGMFVSNMTDQVVDTVYSDKKAVIAGSGYPAGRAKRVENGYLIKGLWHYCSGSQYATTFTATCTVENDDSAEDKVLAFVLNREQVNVLDDWNAFGMKGTGSHSINIVDQFVPDDYVFSVFDVKNEYGYEVHTFPFITFSEASFGAICLGISEHFLEKVTTIIEEDELSNENSKLADLLEIEHERWLRANNIFHETLHSAWQEHLEHGTVSEGLQETFSTVARRTATTTITCTNNLFRHLGMQMIMQHSTINQIWRDLHTAAQHMFLKPENKKQSIPY